MPRFDGGLLICWQQTARRRGSIQKKKIRCKNGIIARTRGKGKMRRERKTSAKGEPDDQEAKNRSGL